MTIAEIDCLNNSNRSGSIDSFQNLLSGQFQLMTAASRTSLEHKGLVLLAARNVQG